jgi:membrane fusion protein, copper/silver efflux system
MGMTSPQDGEQIYTCPMHKNVRQDVPGKCPQCGMALLPEGTRFAMVRHILSNPLPLAVMGAIMVVLTIAAMMMR